MMAHKSQRETHGLPEVVSQHAARSHYYEAEVYDMCIPVPILQPQIQEPIVMVGENGGGTASSTSLR
jgi:hypothetical protein